VRAVHGQWLRLPHNGIIIIIIIGGPDDTGLPGEDNCTAVSGPAARRQGQQGPGPGQQQVAWGSMGTSAGRAAAWLVGRWAKAGTADEVYVHSSLRVQTA
jgi:hypothetical protein